MWLNDELIRRVTSGGDAALTELRAMHQRMVDARALQPSAKEWTPVFAVPLVLDAAERELLGRTSTVVAQAIRDVPALGFGDLATALERLRVPAALRPFIRAEIPLTVEWPLRLPPRPRRVADLGDQYRDRPR